MPCGRVPDRLGERGRQRERGPGAACLQVSVWLQAAPVPGLGNLRLGVPELSLPSPARPPQLQAPRFAVDRGPLPCLGLLLSERLPACRWASPVCGGHLSTVPGGCSSSSCPQHHHVPYGRHRSGSQPLTHWGVQSRPQPPGCMWFSPLSKARRCRGGGGGAQSRPMGGMAQRGHGPQPARRAARGSRGPQQSGRQPRQGSAQRCWGAQLWGL